MEKKHARRDRVMDLLEEHGGLAKGISGKVSAETGVPEADVFGVATFYSLLHKPDAVRVCQGLSCELAGSDALSARMTAKGVAHELVSCLGQCDRAPVSLDSELELDQVAQPGAVTPDDPELPMNLGGADDRSYAALARARALGHDAVFDMLKTSGLQGRGGAGFPAWIKWNAVRNEADPTHYVVVNADEGEPGTFKDREVMLRRPHLMLEGVAIAAWFAEASTAYIYVRGEFQAARRSLETALVQARPHLGDLDVRFVMGHGAYICGEETALLEAIEGRRGMPRLKPPYPTQQGLWGKPTLMNNVETLACVPSIVLRGGDWFREQGRTEPGSKLYCISGHVVHPGTYELPLGATLDELVVAAGGYVGTPRAFSPGGASSGFLPMSFRDTPLDFKGLQAPEVGSMLGSAGVVVLNDTVRMDDAARNQQVFFEDESCGQCAPCRIGCRIQRQTVDRFLADRDPAVLAHVDDLHWEMEEGSICGLGMVASLPLQSAMKHFPEDFDRTRS
jgi:NADH:ubiquinone oxidoreductase subunit F (NADH-binding)